MLFSSAVRERNSSAAVLTVISHGLVCLEEQYCVGLAGVQGMPLG